VTSLPCPRCQLDHWFGAHVAGERVKLRPEARRLGIAAGTVGIVTGYTARPWVGQIVRVAFKRRGLSALELELTPCELESVDPRVVRIAGDATGARGSMRTT
jgi:hypothetical protein